MRESLLTIPITDVFVPKCGCPLCHMRDTLENRAVEYIMGAAMMEPDIRIETNRLGFCYIHYNQMLLQKNRLALGLMLNTHLQEIRKNVFNENKLFGKGINRRKCSDTNTSCFVCSKIDKAMSGMITTIFDLYEKEDGFRKLLCRQDYICMPHFELLCTFAPEKLPKKPAAAFIDDITTLVKNYISALNADVETFCNSFDYRNAGKLHSEDMEEVRISVNRAIAFLTSRKPSDK